MGCLDEAVTEIFNSGFSCSGLLCLNVSGLISSPHKAGERDGSILCWESRYLSNFREDTGVLNRADACDELEGMDNSNQFTNTLYMEDDYEEVYGCALRNDFNSWLYRGCVPQTGTGSRAFAFDYRLWQ